MWRVKNKGKHQRGLRRISAEDWEKVDSKLKIVGFTEEMAQQVWSGAAWNDGDGGV